MDSPLIASTSAPASGVVFRSFASTPVFPIRALIWGFAIMAKKKVPRRVPFYATSLRLVTAARAGQVLQRQGRAVYRRTAAPAVGARTHVTAGRRIGGQRRIAVYHRCQRYRCAVNVGLDPRCDQYHDLAVGIALDLVDVLRRSAGYVLPAPVIRYGRGAAGLVHLGNRTAACACGQDHLGHLRPDGVVLVRG